MTKEMQARIALLKRWAAALRSGEYEQTRGKLREARSDRMCCLGVLCDLTNPRGWTKTVNGKFLHLGEYGAPADGVMRKAGIRGDAADFVELNDDQNATFAEIADAVDWIRFDLEDRARA